MKMIQYENLRPNCRIISIVPSKLLQYFRDEFRNMCYKENIFRSIFGIRTVFLKYLQSKLINNEVKKKRCHILFTLNQNFLIKNGVM